MNIDEAAVPFRSSADLRALADGHAARHRQRLRLRNGAAGAVIVVMIAVVASSVTGQSTAVRSTGPASSPDERVAATADANAPAGRPEGSTANAPTERGAVRHGEAPATSEGVQTAGPTPSAPSRAVKLLFRRHNEGIFVANADGSGPRRIDGGAAGYGYSFSPDGRSVLWTDDGALRLLSLDTGAQTVLFEGEVDDGALDAAWMPDGRSVVFLRHIGLVDRTFDLTLLDVESTLTRRLRTVESVSPPAVSPDGRIAYRCAVDDRPRLCLTNQTGADLGFVPNSAGSGEYSWSPDGKWLAVTDFVAGAQRSAGLVALRVDGLVRRELVRDEAPFRPDWLDDGRIAFGLLGPDPTHPDAERGIWSVSLDGSGLRQLTTGADHLEDVG